MFPFVVERFHSRQGNKGNRIRITRRLARYPVVADLRCGHVWPILIKPKGRFVRYSFGIEHPVQPGAHAATAFRASRSRRTIVNGGGYRRCARGSAGGIRKRRRARRGNTGSGQGRCRFHSFPGYGQLSSSDEWYGLLTGSSSARHASKFHHVEIIRN